ncbi:MAG TPA: spore germination protein GerW family protein [Polyangiaceae bacterium]
MDLKDLMQELLEQLGKVASADAVVGGVRDAGKAKVLPLSRVSIGFGTAIGSLDGKAKRGTEESDAGAQAGGAGGAIVVEPRAFVVVGEDGTPHMLALANGKQAVVRRGVKILPTSEPAPALAGADAAARLGDGKS